MASEVNQIGIDIRDYRQQNRLTQAELAAQLGVSRNYLSQIERGVATNLSWRIMERLQLICGISGESLSVHEERVMMTTPPLSRIAEALERIATTMEAR